MISKETWRISGAVLASSQIKSDEVIPCSIWAAAGWTVACSRVDILFGHSVDYPKPIVDHERSSKENMAKMKAAYDAHKAQASEDGCSDDGGWGMHFSRPFYGRSVLYKRSKLLLRIWCETLNLSHLHARFSNFDAQMLRAFMWIAWTCFTFECRNLFLVHPALVNLCLSTDSATASHPPQVPKKRLLKDAAAGGGASGKSSKKRADTVKPGVGSSRAAKVSKP